MNITFQGEWPWSDVFLSRETDNILLSNLSAGPVGIGDALGQEDLGDRDKFVSNGKQRIAFLRDQPGELAAEVLFAPTETRVTLHGYADAAPTVDVLAGHANPG